MVTRSWGPSGPHAWGTDPSDFDPAYTAALRDRVSPLFGDRDRWFPLDVKGWENLPPPPALLVSNHSGGTTIPDLWGFVFAWLGHERGRVLHVMGHDMIFALPSTARTFARLGVLRARPELALDALTHAGRDVLVCPGGDRDTWRPFPERYKVRFSGRTGYARIAVRAGVPVVPVANAGAHETLVVLADGAPIARLLGLPRNFRAEIFPIHLSVPWGLGVGPTPHLPLPTTLRYRIGAPIPPPTGLSEDAAVERLDAQVRAAVQGLLDELRAERPGLADRARRAIRLVRSAGGLR